MLNYLLFIIVIVLTAIYARRYNFIHGIISFFFFASILVGASVLMSKISMLSSFLNTYQPMSDLVEVSFVKPLKDFINVAQPSFVLTDLYFYGGISALFVVSQIFATIIRNHRKNKAENSFGSKKYRKY